MYMNRIGNSKEPTKKQIENILSNLIRKYPNKTFQLTIVHWHHDTKTVSWDYQIGILPAFDNSSCQHIDTKSWKELLIEYRRIMRGDYD